MTMGDVQLLGVFAMLIGWGWKAYLTRRPEKSTPARLKLANCLHIGGMFSIAAVAAIQIYFRATQS